MRINFPAVTKQYKGREILRRATALAGLGKIDVLSTPGDSSVLADGGGLIKCNVAGLQVKAGLSILGPFEPIAVNLILFAPVSRLTLARAIDSRYQ